MHIVFIWSYNAQSNTFNNISMVNFRDIEPQSFSIGHNGFQKIIKSCVIMAEGPYATLYWAQFLETDSYSYNKPWFSV